MGRLGLEEGGNHEKDPRDDGQGGYNGGNGRRRTEEEFRLRRDCLEVMLESLRDPEREERREGRGEGGERDQGVREAGSRVKLKWNACCALTSFLEARALQSADQVEKEEGEKRAVEGGREGWLEDRKRDRDERGPVVVALLHALLTDKNAKVKRKDDRGEGGDAWWRQGWEGPEGQ